MEKAKKKSDEWRSPPAGAPRRAKALGRDPRSALKNHSGC